MKETNSKSGILRLAQEYEAAFGTGRLEDFLRKEIPNMDYVPGDFHKRLLRLPWADVFTTNWDTLIERSREDVFERAYAVVHTMSETRASQRHRIGKLHGTFPSCTPFIFTEEHFRTYPTRFAPFVNMVQEAMMENVFCLLGFSGDDPNFLQWSGWVRDNLGKAAPRIYLVGWLDLAPPRRLRLEERHVIPIDLSHLPQASSWPKELRHQYAIEWFLSALKKCKPQAPIN